MNPEQPNYQPPKNDGSAYDFFMTPEKTPKRPLLPGMGSKGSNPLVKRVALIAGGVFVVIILLYVVVSVLGGSSTNTTALTTVAQEQNELVRVATLATTDAVAQTTRNFAQSANLGLTTDQQQLLAFLQTHNVKLSTQVLAATKNTNTDQQLTTATQASDFDQIFIGIMQAQLNTYKTSLKSAYSSSPSTTEKQLLTADYNHAGLLLQQLNTTSN